MGVWGGEAHWHLFVFKFPSLILQIILIYNDNSKKSSAIPPNYNVSKKNILLLPFVLKKTQLKYKLKLRELQTMILFYCIRYSHRKVFQHQSSIAQSYLSCPTVGWGSANWPKMNQLKKIPLFLAQN